MGLSLVENVCSPLSCFWIHHPHVNAQSCTQNPWAFWSCFIEIGTEITHHSLEPVRKPNKTKTKAIAWLLTTVVWKRLYHPGSMAAIDCFFVLCFKPHRCCIAVSPSSIIAAHLWRSLTAVRYPLFVAATAQVTWLRAWSMSSKLLSFSLA